MGKALSGAKVAKRESKNELEEAAVAAQGKPSGIEAFLKAKKVEEERISRATSADLEVIKDVNPKQLLELQGIDARGRPTGKLPRLYGYDPKTRIACVLKEEFLEKQAGKKKGE